MKEWRKDKTGNEKKVENLKRQKRRHTRTDYGVEDEKELNCFESVSSVDKYLVQHGLHNQLKKNVNLTKSVLSSSTLFSKHDPEKEQESKYM